MALSEPWRGLLLGQPTADPSCSLELQETGTFKVTGYTPDQVAEILAAWRNHAALMIDLMQRGVPSPDAVRYQPEGS